ncbi:MAG: histidine phosphatase family protein, partial [Dehalococcoidales bacterium]
TNTFLDRLKDHEPSQSILVVSSSGPLRVLVCTLFGVDQNHWRQVRLDNASLSILDTYPFGAIISLLNDTSHLKEID